MQNTTKIAVITGAASGIGLALSQTYLQKDACVVMVDKDESKLNQEVTLLADRYPGKIMAVTCDITKSEQVHSLVQAVQEQFGRVDWIYNNAGIIGELGPVWELKPENLHQVMEVNLFGMVNLIQAFIPLLFAQNFRSHIINMASLYALCTGTQMAAYSMSKHAVLALSESLYFDLNRLDKPVDVSVVFPSFTDTSLLSKPVDGANPDLYASINKLITRSRPALDVAQHIVQEVDQKRFYILPDKEVKTYCEDRVKAIIEQEVPHRTNVEKLVCSLLKRL